MKITVIACDVCNHTVNSGEKYYKVRVDNVDKDVCHSCYNRLMRDFFHMYYDDIEREYRQLRNTDYELFKS